jgi:hypothetical protein
MNDPGIPFPIFPRIDQIYASAGARFRWDGLTWTRMDTEVITAKAPWPPKQQPQHNNHVVRWRAMQRTLSKLAG